MDFIYTDFKLEILVEHLVTVHYFEYSNDFFFPGEAHDFWEFLYVDKGQVEVTADGTTILLKKDDLLFHKPMEFHSLLANGTTAPNLIVVTFVCHSPAMQFFEHRLIRANDNERPLLAQIINEAYHAYSSDLSNPILYQLEKRPDPLFGCEEMIKLNLELLLLQLIRRESRPHSSANSCLSNSFDIRTAAPLMRRKSACEEVERIIHYMEENVTRSLNLDDICRDNLIGRSYLQKIFREKQGGGIMEYFNYLKINAAKQLIRNGSYNFTQIARDLGFASIHYFSRRFKLTTGMTPTEYASSVKIMLENQDDGTLTPVPPDTPRLHR